MSGNNAVVGRPARIGLPLSGSHRRASVIAAVRDMALPPAIPAPRNGVGFRDACHGNCAAAWGNSSVGIGLLHRPVLMVISFPNGARALMNHIHTLLPTVCINHVTKRPIIP